MSHLYELSKEAHEDSKRWFPQTAHNAFFAAACMSGEVGEVLNLLKKVERGSYTMQDKIIAENLGEEIADVFTYMLNLCGILDIDLEALYHVKREYNETRFGK